MKYQFHSEDEHTFTVKHPDGSQFQIAKSAVGPEVHKRIKSLEPIKMADGGVVPGLEDSSSTYDSKDLDTKKETPFIDEISRSPASDPASDQPQDQSAAGIWLRDKLGVGQPVQPPAVEQEASRVPQSEAISTSPIAGPSTPPVIQPTAPTPQNLQTGMNDAYGQAFAQKEASVKAQGAAQEQAGKAQAAAYAQQQEQIANASSHYEQEHAAIDAEHKQIVDAVMNDKVDPNRFLGNASTGNKILAAISVLFSGIGSGLSGQPNMAMSVIQKSIDRDMEAQKMELGKKQTLLSENLHRYGNLTAATNQTMLQMNAMTQAKVSQIAATSGSQQAIASAQGMLGDLKLQQAQLQQKQTVLNMAAKGGNYDPSVLVPHLVPEAKQAEVFKEIKDAQNIRNGAKEGLAAFDKANSEQSLFSKNVIPGVNSPYIGQLKASVLPQFQNIDGTVRQAAMDAFLPTITPQVGDSPHTIKVKRETLQNWYVAHSSAPTAQGYGINLDNFGSTTTQRPPETKTVNGIKYMRGPNGQAIQVK